MTGRWLAALVGIAVLGACGADGSAELRPVEASASSADPCSRSTTTGGPPDRIRVDVDGDGRVDVLTVEEVRSGRLHENPDEPDTCVDPEKAWRIHGRLTSGTTVDQLLDVDSWKTLGATDVNRDGRSQLWFPLPGATAHNVSFLVYDRGEVVRPTMRDDEGVDSPASLLWSQNSNCCAGYVPGVRCVDVTGDHRLEVVQTSHDLGLTFVDEGPDGGGFSKTKPETWGYTAYQLEGRELVLVAATPELESPPSIAGLDFDGGLDCAGVTTSG